MIAAYQHVYRRARPRPAADLATAFTMATLFSHGATHLLAGEAGRVLVDPYYVDNHVAERVDAATCSPLVRLPGRARRAPRSTRARRRHRVVGGLATTTSSTSPTRRRRRGRAATRLRVAASRGHARRRPRLVVHLVNLVGQDDTAWDAAATPGG